MSDLTYEEAVAARLTILEFAVEVMLANFCAGLESPNSEEFKADFKRVSRKTYGPVTGDMDVAQSMQRITDASNEIADRLIDKVARREQEIRLRHRLSQR